MSAAASTIADSRRMQSPFASSSCLFSYPFRFSSIFICLFFLLLSLFHFSNAQIYSTQPQNSYTFDSAPDSFPSGTSFTWVSNANGRNGIAQFNGVNDQVNLNSFPDRYGNPLATTQGSTQGISIEVWARYTTAATYARVVNIGRTNRINEFILAAFTNSAGFFRVSDSTAVLEPPNTWPVNTWRHVVMSLTRNDVNSATATLRAFINGVLVDAGNIPWPAAYDNLDGNWLGKSNFPADPYFTGQIDSFHIYNYGLQEEQVGAHYITTLPPVFELAFSFDPRPWVGIQNTANYKWFTADTTYVNQTYSNDGLISLDGTNNQYIDLLAGSGPNSVGTTINPMYANVDSSITEITYEVTFMLPDYQWWSRVFAFCSGFDTDTNEISLRFAGDSSQLLFLSTNSGVESNTIIVNNFALGKWYHIVIAITRDAGIEGSGTATVYVNGARIKTETMRFPGNVNRPYAFLGRSCFSIDERMNGTIDSFRIYNYAVTQRQVASLYLLTRLPERYQTGPRAAYTFDTANSIVEVSGERDCSWKENQEGHFGMASFNGQGQFLDLLAVPDRGGYLPLSSYIGGAMSFETWVYARGAEQWSRVFELGNGEYSDNIGLSHVGSSRRLKFWISENNIEYLLERDDSWILDRWVHYVCTVSQSAPSVDPTAPDAAVMDVYIDGERVLSRQSILTPYLTRMDSFLGKSIYAADAYFRGEIDSFYYYDYGLSQEQVQAHRVMAIPPIFELVFSSDPATWLNLAANEHVTYSWIQTSSETVNGTSTVNGIVTFNGNGQYVDLAATTGGSSVGTVIPTFNGSATAYTFEAMFRIDSRQTWSRIYDLSQGDGAGPQPDGVHGIRLYMYSDQMRVDFMVTNENYEFERLVVIPLVTIGTWYHVVVVVKRGSCNTCKDSVQTSYVNGIQTNEITNGYWPIAIARPYSFLGKSARADTDAFFHGSIDSFRIYDYALPERSITALAALVTVPDLYVAGPKNAYTFDTALETTRFNPGSVNGRTPDVSYLATASGRYGVADFDGFDDWIALDLLYDHYGQNFFTDLGGSPGVSMELWARYLDLNQRWSRVADIGSSPEYSHFHVGHPDTSTPLYVSLSNNAYMSDFPVWNISEWHHIVLSSTQISPSDSTSATSSVFNVYVDGKHVSSHLQPVTPVFTGTWSFLGRSPFSYDQYFKGQIDAFYTYNYGLSKEQVQVHYLLTGRVPIFELTFASDPRVWLGDLASQATYGWLEMSSNSTDEQDYNQGVVTLNGQNQYVDIGQTGGLGSIGTHLPVFGAGDSYTFETIFRSPRQQRWGRVYDMSQVPGKHHVMLALVDQSLVIGFSVHDVNYEYKRLECTTIELNRWYHIIVTVERSGLQTCYVNGVKTNSISNGNFPANVARTHSFLGRSAYNPGYDEYFNGRIDAFRIFDYTLSDKTIQDLFVASANPLFNWGNTSNGSSSKSSGATTALIVILTLLGVGALGTLAYFAHKNNYWGIFLGPSRGFSTFGTNGDDGWANGRSDKGDGWTSGRSDKGTGLLGYFGGKGNKKSLLEETEMEDNGSYKPVGSL